MCIHALTRTYTVRAWRCKARLLKVLRGGPSVGFRGEIHRADGGQNRGLISVFTSTSLIRTDYVRSAPKSRRVQRINERYRSSIIVISTTRAVVDLAGRSRAFVTTYTTVARIINDRTVKESSRAVSFRFSRELNPRPTIKIAAGRNEYEIDRTCIGERSAKSMKSPNHLLRRREQLASSL